MKNLLLSVAVFSILLVSGCATIEPYDYQALKQHAPRSILVIPPINNSVEVNAPYTYLSTVTQPLAEKGYYVFPVSVIDNFLKENGLPTPVEMNSVPLEKIDEIIGADAVLYVDIQDWGQKFQVFSSVTVVKANIKLISVKTGELLWDAPIYAQHDPNSGNSGGLVGALVGAVVSQIAGELTDNTPSVARIANSQAFYSQKRGLLTGPYYQEPKK
ncbi:hypothetical protein DXX93_12750 [Thalassotalea euphylliae]|uniref:Lipoprotein n=1 Tax=Thalassotalea euphylliae TaxID=1655234 RepID=A0A3E0TSN5_9GAMM|nr:GNA1162 family protein [Thalassotalea euphylliae]REL27347.1 hypothetical protein DXX93_12750 [Thalassotalea euphylliae]